MLIEDVNHAVGNDGTCYPPLPSKPVTMTQNEVSAYLGVSKSMVSKLAKQGKIRVSKLFGRNLYYRGQIEELLTREFNLPPVSYRRRK